jgi:hypothetical protein
MHRDGRAHYWHYLTFPRLSHRAGLYSQAQDKSGVQTPVGRKIFLKLEEQTKISECNTTIWKKGRAKLFIRIQIISTQRKEL